MSVTQGWIIMTTAERDASTLLDDEDAMLGAREVDHPLANNIGEGTMVGMWVAPARLLNDPAYARWVPTLTAPEIRIRMIDDAVLFIPPPVDE